MPFRPNEWRKKSQTKDEWHYKSKRFSQFNDYSFSVLFNQTQRWDMLMLQQTQEADLHSSAAEKQKVNNCEPTTDVCETPRTVCKTWHHVVIQSPYSFCSLFLCESTCLGRRLNLTVMSTRRQPDNAVKGEAPLLHQVFADLSSASIFFSLNTNLM